ncbi:MAG TPA: SufE family protein [Abditibacteriaceae bacterium]|jgi:sulfur transfer protein SufE
MSTQEENSQQENAEALVDAFDSFDSWEERYAFLIDLGKKLPPLDADDKNDVNRVHGCQSSVWMVAKPRHEEPEDVVEFVADSDSTLVKGLIAILRKIYSGQSASRILGFDIEGLLQQLGLNQHLTVGRRNGLYSMVQRIKTLAAQLAGHDGAAKAEAATNQN